MGHALTQFGDLLLQGGEPFAEFLTLGGQLLAEFSLFGIEVPTLGGQLLAEFSLFGIEVPTLGGQLLAEFSLFGIEVPTLGGQLGTDGPLSAQHQPGQGRSDRYDSYQNADQFNTHDGSPYPPARKRARSGFESREEIPHPSPLSEGWDGK
jgi:hypothetical protein